MGLMPPLARVAAALAIDSQVPKIEQHYKQQTTWP
jgi:hypothetical protein